MHVLVLYFFEQLNCNNWETETEKFRSLAFYLAYRRADVGNATFLSTLFPLSPLSKTFHFPRIFFGKWKVFGKFLESFGKSVKNALFWVKKNFHIQGLSFKNFPKKKKTFQKLSKLSKTFHFLTIFRVGKWLSLAKTFHLDFESGNEMERKVAFPMSVRLAPSTAQFSFCPWRHAATRHATLAFSRSEDFFWTFQERFCSWIRKKVLFHVIQTSQSRLKKKKMTVFLKKSVKSIR